MGKDYAIPLSAVVPLRGVIRYSAELDRLREATDLLELLAADRHVLAGLPDEDRRRFLRALELVRGPSSRTRRRQVKAAAR